MTRMATNVLSNTQMADRIIVMRGSGQFDFERLAAVADEFGFRTEIAADAGTSVGRTNVERKIAEPFSDIAAVFFHRDALGPGCSWFDALWTLRSDFPGARLVVCHGFADDTDWQRLSDAGAYYALWLPLRDSELRQCLGFIWEAERKTAQRLPVASTGVQRAGTGRLPEGNVLEFSHAFPAERAAEPTAA